MGDPIYLASDHRGYPLKQALRGRLEASGHEVCDLGPDGTESVDYREFAALRREVEALCAHFPIHSCSGAS